MLSQNTLIARLDALETFLSLQMPIGSLEYRDHVETIAQARRELKDCWHEMAKPDPEPEYRTECPACGNTKIECRLCGWGG